MNTHNSEPDHDWPSLLLLIRGTNAWSHCRDFTQQLETEGFWRESGQTRSSAFLDAKALQFATVLVSVNIRGETYCVVQAIPAATAGW